LLKIVDSRTTTIFVAAMISTTVILLGSATTTIIHRSYAQYNNNDLPTVREMISSFSFIPLASHSTAGPTPATSNVTQSSTNQTTSNSNNTFLTYTNSAYGIKVQYPSTWTRSANQSSNEIVRFLSPPGIIPISLNIIVRTGVSQLIPLQVYVNAGIAMLKKSFSHFNLISSNATSIGGVPAEEMVYTANLLSGHKLKFIQFLAIRDTTSYVVTSGTLADDFATYLPTVQKMISSLSFVPVTTMLSSSNETAPMRSTSNQTTQNSSI
jgi:hypothetical protein